MFPSLPTHIHAAMAPDARRVYRVKTAWLHMNLQCKRKNKKTILFNHPCALNTNYGPCRNVGHIHNPCLQNSSHYCYIYVLFIIHKHSM